jgi:hypothetical protein
MPSKRLEDKGEEFNDLQYIHYNIIPIARIIIVQVQQNRRVIHSCKLRTRTVEQDFMRKIKSYITYQKPPIHTSDTNRYMLAHIVEHSSPQISTCMCKLEARLTELQMKTSGKPESNPAFNAEIAS